MKKNLIIIISLIIFVLIIMWCRYYPTQSMPIGKKIEINTPFIEKYNNDCLHPSIKYINDSLYLMAQTPYYGWQNKLENPIYYVSNNPYNWKNGKLLVDTPLTGYNSDPNLFYEDGKVYLYYREGSTPLCDSLNTNFITLGGEIVNDSIIDFKPILINRMLGGDTEMCPILIKKDSIYRFYGVWYEFEPERKNKGIAIWESSYADKDFVLKDTIEFDAIYTVDRCVQIKLFDYIFYLPIPLKHDLWHFDLFEYDNKLYMVSVAEKGDNIMLSVSEDYKHFKTYKKPLINNHYTENYVGYRQYYYKPTCFVKNDSLYLYYTSQDKENPAKNNLYLSVESIDIILE